MAALPRGSFEVCSWRAPVSAGTHCVCAAYHAWGWHSNRGGKRARGCSPATPPVCEGFASPRMVAWVRSDSWLLLSGTMRNFYSAVTVPGVLLVEVLASRPGGLTC